MQGMCFFFFFFPFFSFFFFLFHFSRFLYKGPCVLLPLQLHSVSLERFEQLHPLFQIFSLFYLFIDLLLIFSQEGTFVYSV